MPQSKTHSSRAKKLAKRRADQQRRAVPQTYVAVSYTHLTLPTTRFV